MTTEALPSPAGRRPEQRVETDARPALARHAPRTDRRESAGNQRPEERVVLEPPRRPPPSVLPTKQEDRRGTVRIGAIEVRILPPPVPKPAVPQPAPAPTAPLSSAMAWRFGLRQG